MIADTGLRIAERKHGQQHYPVSEIRNPKSQRRYVHGRGHRFAGRKERAWRLLSESAVTVAEHIFWAKRGFAEPPGTISYCSVARSPLSGIRNPKSEIAR